MNNNSRQVIATSLSILFILTVTLAFKNQADQTKADDNSSKVKSESWFTIKPIADQVWRIGDHGNDNIYLVEGKEKALLIDTGIGAADLKQCVKSITELPVIVVNTHGHPDHCGGNFQFEEVYAHPLDFEMVKQFNSKEHHGNTVENALKNSPDLESVIGKDLGEFKSASLLPVESGDVFDLGDRKLEVVEVPGHTEGSICLLDSENDLLFTGDNNNILVWLFLDGCLPLDAYLETLINLKQRAEEFETILPGHGEPLDKAFIDEQITCAQNILSGACKGEPYNAFAGDGLLCTYKRAGIAFNPDNLHSK